MPDMNASPMTLPSRRSGTARSGRCSGGARCRTRRCTASTAARVVGEGTPRRSGRAGGRRRRAAMASNPRLPDARCLAGLRVGVARRLADRGTARAAPGAVPSALKWSRNGPNSSPIQSVPSAAPRTSDSMSKSPPVNSRVRRGLVDDRERDPIGVGERDEVTDSDRAGAAIRRLPVEADVVEAQQEIGGVGLGAEAVVGHAPRRCRRRSRPCRRTPGSPGPRTGRCDRWPA